jgi:hypothetical protein
MSEASRIFSFEDDKAEGGPIDVLSGSSLNTFLRCARQWEYAYVFRLRRPPALRMVTGTAGHKAAEVHMLAKRESGEDGPVAIALDAFSDSFDIEVKEAETTPAEAGEWKDKGTRSVKLWHKEIAPSVTPVHIEQPISFYVNDVPYTGTIDLVDAERVIRDWKFTNRTPSSAEPYLLNLIGYAVGYRTLTGEVESAVELDHIVQLKTPKPFIIKSDGPVTDRAIASFADTVETVTRSIQAGIFPPNGLKSGACSWCGYRDICPAYKEASITPQEISLEDALAQDPFAPA